MTRRLPLALLLAAALLGTAAAPAVAVGPPATWAGATAPDPANDTTWSLHPAVAEGADERVSLRHTLDGGGTAADFVALTNFSSHPAVFGVYASDGTLTADGDFDLIPSDQESVGGGSWISVLPVEGSVAREGGGLVVTAPAQTTVLIPVEIRVPANATPGDHPAGIVAELVPADGAAVQLASRVGVRVHLRVAGEISALIGARQVTTEYVPSWNPFAPGTARVSYTTVNDGNVRLGARSETRLSGPFGIAAVSSTSESREILPGQTAAVTVEVPIWPTFFSSGTIVTTPLRVGDDQIDSSLTAATTDVSVWTIPWSQLALLIALVLTVLLIIGLRRRQARLIQARIDAAVAAASAAAVAAPSTSSAVSADVAPPTSAVEPSSEPSEETATERIS